MKHNAIIDSSFWINAHRSGLLPHLLERYTLHYPPEVAVELREEFLSGREFRRLAQEGVLVEVPTRFQQVQSFGPGERSAINLALEHRNWVLLIDDRRPFLEAARLELRVLSTPVLAVQLFSEGKLDVAQALEALARLAALQTVSPDLLAAALAHLGRIWKQQGGR